MDKGTKRKLVDKNDERKRPADTGKRTPSYPPLAGNELLLKWRANRASLPEEFSRLLDPALAEEQRGDLFEAEDEETMARYSWAIPDDRALRICAAYSPLVEMGAGAGYWARLLRERGVDVTAFDCDTGDATRAAGVAAAPWTEVLQGGPEDAARFPGHALLLMYPDDLEAHEETQEEDAEGGASEDGEDGGLERLPLSVATLAAYKGDTVIHVGEWMGETLTLSMEGQALPDIPYPWGRSTDPRFQTLLAATFHKVLQAPLPNWGSVSNTITVWKRTATAVIEGDRYAYVPADERIEYALAAPSTRHLLKQPASDNHK